MVRISPSGAIITPEPFQVLQRDGSDQADIAVSGTYSGFQPTAIEARFNGGEWVTIDAAPSGGAFSGTLSNQAAGQGTLEVRDTVLSEIDAQLTPLGIGDVFIGAGQSNMLGGVGELDTYGGSLIVCAYDVDAGSWYATPTERSGWLMVWSQHETAEAVPVGFANVAVSASRIASWEKGAGDDYYTRITDAYAAIGDAKAVLWQQGEGDALDGTAEATYNTALDGIANNLNGDIGLIMMVAKIHNISGRDETAVNTAINTAWGDNANVLTGPDFSAYVADGDVHFTTVANDYPQFAGVGGLAGWWDAMVAEWFT